ncbi:hypothetical protein [Microbacterium sp.]|uniref:phage tail protein n=1 Tax=Microbacterium sp. TaxID=51671 RepID=UPI002811A805|nr:hypothetical protein [Microbacterium sp.]
MTSPEIGQATLGFIPSAKSFGKALRTDIDPALFATSKRGNADLGRALSRSFAPLGLAAGGAALAAAGATLVANAIAEAGKLEQSIGAINTVFKGSSVQMHGWAQGAATSTGLARNEYNELATLIGSQLKNAGTAMEELGPKTDNLITLGADLASMFGGTSREAVEALSSALKGERDPVERYGVSLNQAAIDAKAAELGFTKVGGALSKEANAAATLALIMDQTADAHGNFAKESTTYEGVMSRLGASWRNVTATIGAGFLPFATAAGSVLLSMTPAVQNLATGFSTFGESMSAAFQEAGGGLPGIAAMFKAIFSSIAEWFTGIDFGDAVGRFLNLALAGAEALVAALPAVVESYLGAYPALVELVWSGFYGGILDAFLHTATALVKLMPTLAPLLLDVVTVALAVLLEAAATLFMSLIESWYSVLPNLVANLGSALAGVTMSLLSMLSPLQATGIELFMALVEAILAVLPDILNTLLVDVLPNVLSTVLGMLPQLLEAGVELFFALVTAILDVLPDILKTLLVDVLPNVLSTVLGMLPQLLEAAIELFFALVEGILTVLPDIVMTLLTDVLPTLLTTLLKMLPRLIAGAIELFGALVAGLLKNLPELINTIIFDVIPAVVGALIDAVPQLLQAGVDLLMGLIDGLWSMASAVGDALLDIIGGAVDGFLGFLGIHSPSRLFRGFGAAMGVDLANELGDVPRSAWTSQDDIAKAVSESFPTASRETPELSPRHRSATRYGSQALTASQELSRAWTLLELAA